MADDILKFFGITPDDKEHPADVETLSFFGLKPVKDEHPAYNPGEQPSGSRVPTPGEMTGRPNEPVKTGLQKIHEAINPSTVIPAAISDIAGNIRDSAVSSANMAAEGLGDIGEGRSATGFGKAALGTLGVPLSLVTGPVKSGENLLRDITGNPDFASKAALMFPLNVGGPAVRTAAHNVHPTTKAADAAAQEVGSNMPEVLRRLESNPRLRPIDVNENLRMTGQGIQAGGHSPEAASTITRSMKESAAGARDAVKGTYNETMGSPPDAWEELTRLQNKAKSVGQAKIAPPLITAKPVDTSAVISDIDKALNPAAVKMTPGTTITPTPLQQELTGIRQKLASGDKEVLTDADRLHDIQSELRRRAEDLKSSGSGSDRVLGRELMDYRNKLVDAIDASAPGYKEGLKAYRDQKDIERAFQMGQDLLVNSKDPKTAPGFLKSWVASKNRTPEELEAARTGARQAIEQKMGSIKQSALDPARSGTDVPQIEFNRQKIEHLFGKENTDTMFKHLQDERDIALSNNRGLGNSKTAETTSYKEKYAPREVSRPHGQLPIWAGLSAGGIGALTHSPEMGVAAGAALLGARGAKSIWDRIGRSGDTSRNNALAALITQNTPETRALLSIAAQRVGQRNKLNNLMVPP